MSQVVVMLASSSEEPTNRRFTRSRFAAFIVTVIVIQIVLAVIFSLMPCKNSENSEVKKLFNSSAVGLHSDSRNIKRIILGDDMPEVLTCKWPLPKSVRVDSVYPSASAIYAPWCVTLYRCGNDSGCCNDDIASQCVVKTEVNVTLRIRVIGLGPHATEYRRIDNLTFTNHTECMCTEN